MFIINDDLSMEIIRGDSGEFEIDIFDDAGQPYVLEEGDRLVFTVKRNTKTEDALIQKEGPEIVIRPNDTEGLKYGKYVYDVQFTFSDGYVDTVIEPTPFIIKEEVTF